MSWGNKLSLICRQVFFPANCCPVCGCQIKKVGPCIECLSKIKAAPRCACGFLLENTVICPICGQGKKASPLAGVLTVWVYEGRLRENILKFKYEGKTYFARPFAALLEAAVREFYSHRQLDAIVPVPLSLKRKRERGYNQAQLCGGFLAQGLGLTQLPNALMRLKETPPLSRQTKEQRFKLMDKAFEADPAQVKGKSILLVDDIFTTGATAYSCAATLIEAGAKEVYGLTLAHTQERNNLSTM